MSAIPGILAPFLGTTIKNASLYLYGEHDFVSGNTPEAIAGVRASLKAALTFT